MARVIAKKSKDLSISVSSKGLSDNTYVTLSNGMNLGKVQSVDWSCKVGELAKCQITTILTKAQLAVLMEDSIIRYRLIDEVENDKIPSPPPLPPKDPVFVETHI